MKHLIKLIFIITINLLFTSLIQAKTILVFGDSLSAEYGIPAGTGWANLLNQKLKSNKSEYSVVNLSISGETTAGGKSRFNQAIQKYKPSIVILELELTMVFGVNRLTK